MLERAQRGRFAQISGDRNLRRLDGIEAAIVQHSEYHRFVGAFFFAGVWRLRAFDVPAAKQRHRRRTPQNKPNAGKRDDRLPQLQRGACLPAGFHRLVRDERAEHFGRADVGPYRRPTTA